MGIWNRVRSLWESDKAVDSIAEDLMLRYAKMRDRYSERDPNAWLAWGLAGRDGWGHADKQELLVLAAPYSIASEETATALLGLDVAVKEYPELQRVAAQKHHELFVTVDFAIKNGTFMNKWKEINPWTDAGYPAVTQELKRGILAGTGSRAAQKVEITCPKCKVELRVPGVTGGKLIRCPRCETRFSVDV
jgi:hypothetical protein